MVWVQVGRFLRTGYMHEFFREKDENGLYYVFMQSQSLGRFVKWKGCVSGGDFTFFVICGETIIRFHSIAYGWEVVFMEDRAIPHIFRHVASTLFGKPLTSHTKGRPKGSCDKRDGRRI